MKIRVLYLLVMFCLMLGGCDYVGKNIDKFRNNKNEVTEVNIEDEKVMTERQEAIFRSYGLSEERIADMKKKGMNFSEKNFVEAAIYMLDHLEEKYDEEFELVGGDTPGLLSDEYWITAQACEGEHAGKEFKVYHKGEQGITDGYINLLKEEEAVEALKNLNKKQRR